MNSVIVGNFLNEKLSESLGVKSHVLKFKLNGSSNKLLRLGSFNFFEEWMINGVFKRQSEEWVEHKAFVQEVNSVWGSPWVFLLQVSWRVA